LHSEKLTERFRLEFKPFAIEKGVRSTPDNARATSSTGPERQYRERPAKRTTLPLPSRRATGSGRGKGRALAVQQLWGIHHRPLRIGPRRDFPALRKTADVHKTGTLGRCTLAAAQGARKAFHIAHDGFTHKPHCFHTTLASLRMTSPASVGKNDRYEP
jgi:hypothetical protein